MSAFALHSLCRSTVHAHQIPSFWNSLTRYSKNHVVQILKLVYIMKKHCYTFMGTSCDCRWILSATLIYIFNSCTHLEQLAITFLISETSLSSFYYMCRYIFFFLFQCSLLYFSSTYHFPVKQVSYIVSLSISEIITKKAGLISTFAELHSGCPGQMSAMTTATLTVSTTSFNQLWYMQVQHFLLMGSPPYRGEESWVRRRP